MKCAAVNMRSSSVCPVRFSTVASNHAGVRGSKNETSQAGRPATETVPRTCAFETPTQKGTGSVIGPDCDDSTHRPSGVERSQRRAPITIPPPSPRMLYDARSGAATRQSLVCRLVESAASRSTYASERRDRQTRPARAMIAVPSARRPDRRQCDAPTRRGRTTDDDERDRVWAPRRRNRRAVAPGTAGSSHPAHAARREDDPEPRDPVLVAVEHRGLELKRAAPRDDAEGKDVGSSFAREDDSPGRGCREARGGRLDFRERHAAARRASERVVQHADDGPDREQSHCDRGQTPDPSSRGQRPATVPQHAHLPSIIRPRRVAEPRPMMSALAVG